MGYIIENNNFSHDTLVARSARLHIISENIEGFAAELSLEASLLDWARAAFGVWEAKFIQNTAKSAAKAMAYDLSRKAFGKLRKRYVELKWLLKSRYETDDIILKSYGVDGSTPLKRSELTGKVLAFCRANEERLAAGDPKALPQELADGLNALGENAESLYDESLNEHKSAKAAAAELEALYKEDSSKIRVLYNWCVSFWGPDNPELMRLSFAYRISRSWSRTAAPANLEYQAPDKFSWEPVKEATSYQLAYSPAGKKGGKDWMEAWRGAGLAAVFAPPPGDWLFRVRSRSKSGYGNWSDAIEVKAE